MTTGGEFGASGLRCFGKPSAPPRGSEPEAARTGLPMQKAAMVAYGESTLLLPAAVGHTLFRANDRVGTYLFTL